MKNKFLKVLLAMIFALCFFAFAGPSCRAEAAEGKGLASMTDNKNAVYTKDLSIKEAARVYYDETAFDYFYYLYPGQKIKLSDKIYYKGNQVSFSQVKVNTPSGTEYTKISSDHTVIAAKAYGCDEYQIIYKTYKIDLYVWVIKPTAIKSVEDVSAGMKISWTDSGRLDDGVYIYRSINGGAYTKVKKVYYTSKSWIDTDATKVGAKYSYKIKTFVKGYSELEKKYVYFISDYSSAKTCSRTTVAVPKISQVVNFSKGPCVKWESVKNVSGYFIYRRIGDGSYEKVKTITDPTVVQWTDTKATKNGQKYVYKMYAYTNVSGKTLKSAVSNAGVIYRLSRPTVTKIDDDSFSWNANSAATEYEVLLDTITYHIPKGQTSYNTWEVYKEMYNTYLYSEPYRYLTEASVRTVKEINGVRYYSQYSPVVEINDYY